MPIAITLSWLFFCWR